MAAWILTSKQIGDERGFSRRVLAHQQHKRLGFNVCIGERRGVERLEFVGLFQRLDFLFV